MDTKLTCPLTKKQTQPEAGSAPQASTSAVTEVTEVASASPEKKKKKRKQEEDGEADETVGDVSMAVTEDGGLDDAAKAAEKQAKKERKAYVSFFCIPGLGENCFC